MKRSLPIFLRSLVVGLVFLFSSLSSFATHVVGGDIYYTWVSGLTYRITVVLYGDCGPASAGAFASLGMTTAFPQVCIYDGATLLATPAMPFRLDNAVPLAGTEITPVCPDSLTKTQCTSTAFAIPGIKKFVYSKNFTLPYTSANWRFVFNGAYGATSAGRAAAITNIATGGIMELTATLNNTISNNTSPNLTVVPTPFFCLNTPTCYTPGAIDIEGDSLRFDLIPAVAAAAGCAPGSPETYVGTAWGTTPVSATTPLRCVAGSYNFSTVNGQVCFNPNFTQRAIVVYNVSEYRGGVLVGTCQREMTFLVRPCTVFAPLPGTATAGGVLLTDGPTDFHVCGNAGAFSLTLNPRPDATVVPALNVICTATGLPAGISVTVTGNGTPTPTVVFTGNASLMVPGVYTFFLKLKDNACPISGENTIAYTIRIYPVPSISASITTPIDCIHQAGITVVPGGQGDPWTIKVVNTALFPPLDTVASYTTSASIVDWRDPGTYMYVIYTNVSTECNLDASVTVVAPPRLTPTLDISHPTYCGKNDGALLLTNLNAGGIDTFTYDKDGIPQPAIIGTVSSSGSFLIPNLRGGTYSNIVVHYGYCTSLPLGPVVLVDPPFTIGAITSRDPLKCGFCDGWIKIGGLHPDQLDTITYNISGTPQPASSFFIGADSLITLSGLCSGTYTTFTVKTAGVCTATLLTVVPLLDPPITIKFDTLIKPGCKGDTLLVTNLSTPASDLTYSWNFGDGGTATGIDPMHVYTNTAGTTYTIKLTGTNTQCVDSFKFDLHLDHFIKADYSMSATEYVCQIDPVTFTNLSTSLNGVLQPSPPDYKWYFADGDVASTFNVTHAYTNMGTYNTILVAHINTNGVNCYDTMIKRIIVDSNSVLTLKVSGDVTAICRGQAVTFSAIYTTSGDTGNVWELTDGFEMNNINPLMHAFEGVGPSTINFDAKFRACPEKKASVNIHVFDVPTLYLGPDLAMCPGSSPVMLKDEKNYTNPKAKWRWSNDDNQRSSTMTVTKPGVYAATVTIDGCSTTDTVIVEKDCYVDVPNVFTPNGDGVNDYFFPRRFLSKSVVSFKMKIYNRWGQQIYETQSLDGQGWDGALNAIPQPTGVYVYSIDATFKDGQIEQHNGNVTLLR